MVWMRERDEAGTLLTDNDQLSGLVVRVSALRLGGRGFDPRPGHTKDYKNGTQCLPAWHSASRFGLGVSPATY